jgi:trehalose 6-phosphate phosphatase
MLLDMSAPFAPDPHAALFLDFDGTLVDIAPSPDAVCVPSGLVDALQRVAAGLKGALALVSGRPIREIDHWLAPLALPVAGIHGAERRRADGQIERPARASVDVIARVVEALARRHPGLRVEHKGVAVALHYRQAPECEALCLATLRQAVQNVPGLQLLTGKMVLEVLPGGIDKGQAIAAFLREPPFAGRRPVFVGDDVTDEAGFAMVQQMGGMGVKVGPGDSSATLRLPSAQALRDWLAAWRVQHV